MTHGDADAIHQDRTQVEKWRGETKLAAFCLRHAGLEVPMGHSDSLCFLLKPYLEALSWLLSMFSPF